jgi:diguanylate cyclase (GGDEF)-like protein
MKESRRTTRSAPPEPPEAAAPASVTLTEVLNDATRIGELVVQCGSELAQVNAQLERELEDPALAVDTRTALQSNQRVEAKIADAADSLAAVTSDLSGQIRDRDDLETQLQTLAAQEAKARYLALHDELTGLPNRALIHDRLDYGLAQAGRHGWGLAVMFIDLDEFKQINDTHGHAVGDKVLRIVAQRMLHNARSDDTPSRYGGDEFVYLLQEIGTERDVAVFAQELAAVLQEPFLIDDQEPTLRLSVQASIGVAVFPQHGQTAELLLKKADSAMYQAKRSGLDYMFAK